MLGLHRRLHLSSDAQQRGVSGQMKMGFLTRLGVIFRRPVTVQHDGNELNDDGYGEPDLPMRQYARLDREAARDAQVGSEPPHTEYEGRNRGRRQQPGGGEREMTILVLLRPDRGTALKSYPDNHYSRI